MLIWLVKKGALLCALILITFFLFVSSSQADDNECLMCHQDKSSGVSTHAAIESGCTVCHIGVDASKMPHILSGASKGLPSVGAELCFSCHNKKDLAVAKKVHSPVAEGMCDICHDPHVSSFSDLLTSTNVCLSCHENESIGNKAIVHQPIASGICTSCHFPHQSEADNLLRSSIPILCFNCHEKKGILGPNVHLPVGLGMCTFCHDPHQSDEEGLVKSGLPELCFSCHDKDSIIKQEIHQNVDQVTLCMKCHKPH